MARMVHPGPRTAARVQSCPATLRPLAGVLPAGSSVMAGVAALLAAAGCRGGMLRLDGAVCAPLRYVLPALSRDGVHAAWYSDPFDLPGPAAIRRATASLGLRDGAAFLHCHGIWAGADGVDRMGHLLPFDSILAADVSVAGVGCTDAWFTALPDAETGFTLFQPQRAPAATQGPGLLARLAPGEDVVAAIEALCAAHAIREARILGVGSIDHIRFQDGTRVDCLATELHFCDATLRGGRADLPIEVVDIDGRIHRGTLSRGQNPVGVTVEILIAPQEPT